MFNTLVISLSIDHISEMATRKSLILGGLELHCFTTPDTNTPESKKSVIIFAHGRLQKVEKYFDLCQELATANTIVITFSQRNHGERALRDESNLSWKEGNDDHAIDMWTIQYGTARDISYILDILPIILGKLDQQSTNIHKVGVIGFSLGGHTTLLAMANERRLDFGVSIVGCADYLSLMKHRYRQVFNKDPAEDGTSFKSLLPNSLLQVLQLYDPVHRMKDMCDRPLLMLNGGKDQLVPFDCSKAFVDELTRMNPLFKVHVDPEAGHKLTDWMKERMQDFLQTIL